MDGGGVAERVEGAARLQALAAALPGSSLRKLVLDYNERISAVGCEALAQALASPGCRLEELKLRSCELDDAALRKFVARLPEMQSLWRLDVWHNNFSEEAKAELRAAWQKAGKPDWRLET